jgi:hypothetical protein
MIAFKDIPMLLGMAGTLLTGGFYVHDIKRDVAELSSDYRQHVAEQQEVGLMEKRWRLEDRLRTYPDDVATKRELENVDRLMEKNQKQQETLKGGK